MDLKYAIIVIVSFLNTCMYIKLKIWLRYNSTND